MRLGEALRLAIPLADALAAAHAAGSRVARGPPPPALGCRVEPSSGGLPAGVASLPARGAAPRGTAASLAHSLRAAPRAPAPRGRASPAGVPQVRAAPPCRTASCSISCARSRTSASSPTARPRAPIDSTSSPSVAGTAGPRAGNGAR
jgi:hypothetical protein